MPKLSRRKRQLKELNGSRSSTRRSSGGDKAAAAVEDNDQEGSEEEENEEESESNNGDAQPVAAPAPAAKGRGRGRASNGGGRGTAKDNAEKDKDDDNAASSTANPTAEKVWVQCNDCDKWRALPPTVDPDSLPDIWTCNQNIYDPDRATCDAPEENYGREEDLQDQPLKGFLRLWVKKLKNADRAETRMSSATAVSTRGGRKRKVDDEWIRCSNPSCGKWRAISRGIDSNLLLKKLNKNKAFGGETVWYCSMNSWDDTTASCAAPQEPLWNCRWNLNK